MNKHDKVLKGLEDSASGRIRSRGDFTQYIDEIEEDEEVMYKYFDYHCRDCDATKEFFLSEEERNHVRCPVCDILMDEEIPTPQGIVSGSPFKTPKKYK